MLVYETECLDISLILRMVAEIVYESARRSINADCIILNGFQFASR